MGLSRFCFYHDDQGRVQSVLYAKVYRRQLEAQRGKNTCAWPALPRPETDS